MKETELPNDEDITAILPCYRETGDGVEIYLKDGSVQHFPLRMKTVLRALAARHAKSLPLLRARVKETAGGKQALPLPIDVRLVLMPCKVRHPRVPGDETLGCINAAQEASVEEVTDGTPHAVVTLPAGRKIHLLWRGSTTIRRLRSARLLYFEEASRIRAKLF